MKTKLSYIMKRAMMRNLFAGIVTLLIVFLLYFILLSIFEAIIYLAQYRETQKYLYLFVCGVCFVVGFTTRMLFSRSIDPIYLDKGQIELDSMISTLQQMRKDYT